MSKPERSGSIEIADDMGFQAASWRVQRIGWTVMLVIVGAALLGVFGGGPLSTARKGDSREGLTVDYERFVRRTAPQSLRLTLGPASRDSDSTVAVWIDREYLERHQVTSISPEPMTSTLEAGRVTYSFLSRDAQESLVVQLHLEAMKFGRNTLHAGTLAGPPVSLTQIAYP